MNPDIFKSQRNSRMDLNQVYFWTNTVKDWNKVLMDDKYKQIILDSLGFLKNKNQITIYGFVIIPNHIHLIWKLKNKNGKELPHASFNKFTAHEIIDDLKENDLQKLHLFEVNEQERETRIWQRDALAILMDSRQKLEQKLDYTHNNPLSERCSH